MAVERDLGPVSAYALAVAHGYDGTEEQWAKLQAEAPLYAQQAIKAAERAEQAVATVPGKQHTAPAIVDHLHGEAVATDMVSPIEHEVECNVESLNIAPEQTYSGADSKWFPINAKLGDVYTVSVKGYTDSSADLRIAFQGDDGRAETWWVTQKGENGVSYRTITFARCDPVRYRFEAAKPVNLTDIMINKGGLTPYSPYVPDLSKVKASQLGLNAFDVQDYVNKCNEHYYGSAEFREMTGKQWVRFFNPGLLQEFVYPVKSEKGVVCHFGLTAYCESDSDSGLFFDFKYSDGTVSEAPAEIELNGSTAKRYVMESDPAKEVVGIIHYYASVPVCFVTDFQLSYGIDGAFEPYSKTEFTPDVDGTVNGMTSIFPNMTILTDTPGVIIDVDYNADTKKYIDKKFEQLQTAIVNNI